VLLEEAVNKAVTIALINSQIESLNNDFRLLNDQFLTAPEAFRASASDPEIEFFLEYVSRKTLDAGKRWNTSDLIKLPLQGITTV
jgi:hypothetical protein